MKWLVAIVILAAGIFSFKLLEVPPAIEADESSIAYNAALISKTGHDQNNRFLPVFILSSDHVDWKQPTLIYLSALVFKVIGISLFKFKLVNVGVALGSLILMGVVLKEIFKTTKWVGVGMVVFMTTPIIIITSRLGSEGIESVPFSILWLLGVLWYRKKAKSAGLAMAALALGVGLYSYKGMRLIVPPYAILTGMYITWVNWNYRHRLGRKWIIDLLAFGLVLAPFFAIMPLLENKYYGAISERKQSIHIESYRHYAYYWLENLSLGFLFVQGGVGRVFSVELWGTFLLATLPVFLVGLYKAVQEIDFKLFIVIAFVITPILFGFAGSIGYGHRLIAMVPMFVIITTLGIKTWLEEAHKTKIVKLIGLAVVAFFVINLRGFLTYYYFEYPKLNSTHEGFRNNHNTAFQALAKVAKKEKLTPYVQGSVYGEHAEGNKFFELAYFDKQLNYWDPDEELPNNSVLLTSMQMVEGTESLQENAAPLFLVVRR